MWQPSTSPPASVEHSSSLSPGRPPSLSPRRTPSNPTAEDLQPSARPSPLALHSDKQCPDLWSPATPSWVRLRLLSIQQEALQQTPSYSDPSAPLHYRVNNWRACTYCTVCFTSSFKHNVCKDLYFLSQFVTRDMTEHHADTVHGYKTKWWCVQRERTVPPLLYLTCELAWPRLKHNV